MIARACLALALVAGCGLARASVLLECDGHLLKWPSAPVVMDVDPSSLPASSPLFGSLSGVVAGINLNPSRAKVLLRTGAPFAANTIAATANPLIIGNNRGITFREFDCSNGDITSADVFFNAALTWATGPKSTLSLYGGPGEPFDAVAAHELGHALGLEHEDRTYTVMFSVAHHHTNGSTATGYLGEDASDGLVILYGLDSTRRQDLAVSHFRLAAVPDLGSIGHFRTPIYDHPPSGASYWTEMMEVVDFSVFQDNNGDPRFLVFNGQTIFPEFTYENNGADPHTVNIGFFLSADEAISSADRRIGTAAGVTLTRGWVFNLAAPVTLPSDLAEGADFALGAIVDVDNTVSEPLNKANNASYMLIRIAPTRPVTLSFDPVHVRTGDPTTGTVTLAGVAPAGGVFVYLGGDAGGATIPASVFIAAGARTATFTATAPNVPLAGEANLLVYRSGVSGTAQGSFTWASPVLGRQPWQLDRKPFYIGETVCAKYPEICGNRLPDIPKRFPPLPPWPPGSFRY